MIILVLTVIVPAIAITLIYLDQSSYFLEIRKFLNHGKVHLTFFDEFKFDKLSLWAYRTNRLVFSFAIEDLTAYKKVLKVKQVTLSG